MARLDRLGFVAIVAGGFALVSCGGSGDASDDTTPDLSSTTVRSQLVTASMQLAQQLSVPAPSTMIAVAASDHQVAESVISGAVLNEHDPVYVVQMTGGEFTSLRHPKDREAPHGGVLTVTYDAQTMRITDVGFDTVAPDLHAIDANVVDLMTTP